MALLYSAHMFADAFLYRWYDDFTGSVSVEFGVA
jgi:hypothetical protein